MCGRVPHIICASTYNSCSACMGNCDTGCGGPNNSYPKLQVGACTNNCSINCTGGCVLANCSAGCLVGPGCSNTCYSSCKTSCYTYSTCMGLATIFYFFIIGNTY